MHIQWSPVFQVHIKIIDEQHEHFVGIMNRLDDAVGTDKSREELLGILDELGLYTDIHFGTEEHYFREFQYEHATEHIEHHRLFVNTLANLRVNYESDPLKLATKLLRYLAEWFEQHVTKADRKYTECFQAHGLV